MYSEARKKNVYSYERNRFVLNKYKCKYMTRNIT